MKDDALILIRQCLGAVEPRVKRKFQNIEHNQRLNTTSMKKDTVATNIDLQEAMAGPIELIHQLPLAQDILYDMTKQYQYQISDFLN